MCKHNTKLSVSSGTARRDGAFGIVRDGSLRIRTSTLLLQLISIRAILGGRAHGEAKERGDEQTHDRLC
jgi:hypothetical protein